MAILLALLLLTGAIANDPHPFSPAGVQTFADGSIAPIEDE